jgi:hypothetical protein
VLAFVHPSVAQIHSHVGVRHDLAGVEAYGDSMLLHVEA